MPPAQFPPTPDALLAHADWIRSLARSLVRDPDTADEVAQRTLLAAWRRPPDALGEPGELGALRAWVARCIANFAHSARRTSERSERSERGAARPEALPSAHDVVERASLSRELVEHVLALEEPYRTAILLRYFDDREPNEIARELDVPAATVRTHVARGLARLRERLDRRHGGREAWSALLLPLTTPGAPAPRLGTLLATSTAAQIAVAAAAGILVLATFALRSTAPPDVPVAAVQDGAGSERAAEPGPTAPTLSIPPAQNDRTMTETAVAPGGTKQAIESAAAGGAHGRVLDIDGRPCPNVRLTASLSGAAVSGGPQATSAADGTFRFPGPLGACRILSDEADHATVLAGVHGNRADESELVVVVAPPLAVEGSVTDSSGSPIEGVHLSIELPDDLRSRFPIPLDRSTEQRFEARTDALGRFHMDSVPRVPDARLVARPDDHETWSARLDEIGVPLAITLLRPVQEAKVLAGRVVDAARQPVPDAFVAFGMETTRSEEDGSFHFMIDDPSGWNARGGFVPLDLRAAHEGRLPARYEPPLEGQVPVWPAFVELQLDAPTLAIEGEVIDHAGNARAGLKVWIADSTTFGLLERGPVQLESLLAGEEQASWRCVETDDGGRFRIDGLLDRAYTIEALEPDTLLRAQVADVPAGTSNAVARIPADALLPRVAGVVRGHDGLVIAGASIVPMGDVFQARWQGRLLGISHVERKGVRTGADGRFELENVPKSLVYLRIDGEGILPLEFGRCVESGSRSASTRVSALPLERIESLDIVVDRRAHLQISLGDPEAADEFALVDGDGVELELTTFVGIGRREGKRQPIRGGRSDVVAGSDRARAVVLFKGGLEVTRLGVLLTPGETEHVRF